jgi:predicted component of viral defense system (DUF524 family)
VVASIKINTTRGSHPPERSEHGMRLAAEQGWLVEGPAVQLDEIAAALPPRTAQRLGAALLLRFGNAVGAFDVPHLGRLEVHSRKWGERHFDAMLADISARMAALPFAAGTGAHLPYDRALGHDERILLHMFIYLRHMCSPRAAPEEQVVPALRLITGAPHRRLERRSEWAPLAQARRVDPRGLVRIFASQAGLERVSAGAGGALAVALRGHLPQRVDESIVRHSVDVPENRFAKAFLDQMLGLVERVRALAQGRRVDYLQRRLLRDCDEIERTLAPARRHPLWDSIGSMHRLPVESTVLQRRRGYRELFTQFTRLRMAARLPLRREQLQRLLEIKDIASLYELWVFFAVEQAVSAHLGRAPDRAAAARVDELQARLPWDLSVAWGDIQLFYNLRFSRSPRRRRSYSLALRPDVVLEVPRGPNAGLHLFDAKFRLDRIEKMTREEDEVDEEDEREEQLGKFKHADVYKMHTYRDALPDARSVWVMYPGSVFGMFEAREGGRLVEDVGELAEVVNGVGGVPARPGEVGAELANLIRAILAQGSK